MNKEQKIFKLKAGLKDLERVECGWEEIRKKGNSMAEEKGHIRLYCFNDKMNRWEYMGTFLGNMKYRSLWGEESEISRDFTELIRIDKKGGAS